MVKEALLVRSSKSFTVQIFFALGRKDNSILEKDLGVRANGVRDSQGGPIWKET